MAPEEPRVAFVTQARKQEDLFTSASKWGILADLLAGPKDTKMVRPFALALHPAGGLLVTDPGRAMTHFFFWGERRYIAVGPKREGGLPSPVGVAALPDGRILVSDSRLGSVEAFDVDGRWLGSFAARGVLSRPAGIAVDAARGAVYVCDVLKHCVAVFDFQGRAIRSIGRYGEGPGEFNYPTHVAVDPQGRIAVTDSMNFRVQLLTADGSAVRSFGRLGDAPGAFSKPKGVAVDSQGRVMIVEGLYDAIEFFDAQGRLLLSVGGSGAGPGQFWLPAGLAYNPAQNLLFVADSYNSRIQVFRLLTEPTSQPSAVAQAFQPVNVKRDGIINNTQAGKPAPSTGPSQ